MTTPLRRLIAFTACLLLTACEDERLLLGESVVGRDAGADEAGAPIAPAVGNEGSPLNPPSVDAGHDAEDLYDPTIVGAQNGDCYELPQLSRVMCAGSTVWQRRIAPIRPAGELTTDANGNTYLLISMLDDTTIDGATIDGLQPAPSSEPSPLTANVLRFAADGKHDWTLVLGGASPDSATFGEALAVSDDRVCVAGSGELPSSFPLATSDTMSSNFIACSDKSGEPLWARRLAATDMVLHDIALDASNRVFVTGYFYRSIDLGGSISATAQGSERQQVLMSLGADGESRWLRTLPGLSPHLRPRVLVLGDDRIVYAGQIADATEFAGLAIDDPFTGSSDGETMAALLVELDADGNAKWATNYVSEHGIDAAFESIAQAPDGRIAAIADSLLMLERVFLYDRGGERVASYHASANVHAAGASFVTSRAGGFVVGARCSPVGTRVGACLFELDENLEAANLYYFAPFDESNSVVGIAIDAQQAVLMMIENDFGDALDLRRFLKE